MIVFDLDDTLYKEKDYVSSGTDEVNSYLRHKYPKATDNEIQNMPWTENEILIYRSHKPKIILADETRQALTAISNAQIPMAIITDGRSIQQRNKFEALKLDQFIPEDRLSISEEIGAEKTEPTAFLKLMEKFPSEKSWMYVGDNLSKDFLHPNRLRWMTVMLIDDKNVNIHPQVPLKDCPVDFRPQFVIHSLNEVLPLYLSNPRNNGNNTSPLSHTI